MKEVYQPYPFTTMLVTMIYVIREACLLAFDVLFCQAVSKSFEQNREEGMDYVGERWDSMI